MTKDEWLDFWNVPHGTPEAEKLWQEKCKMDAKLALRTGKERNPDIIEDIKPYKSMIDGSIITSRSKHRAHLKSHGCIEVGNEIKEANKTPAPKRVNWKQDIINQVYNRKG